MRTHSHYHQTAVSLIDAVPLLDDEFDVDAATYPQEVTEHREPDDAETAWSEIAGAWIEH